MFKLVMTTTSGDHELAVFVEQRKYFVDFYTMKCITVFFLIAQRLKSPALRGFNRRRFNIIPCAPPSSGERSGGVGEVALPSHSTKLANNASQVAGYV